MDTLLQAIRNPAEINNQVWLMLFIILLVVIGGLWFAHRLYRIIVTESKSRYVPNIGRKRLENEAGRRGKRVPPARNSDAADTEHDKVE
ncbi:MAG TPA: hypothetical protein GX696_04230 [Pseudomonadaceae bacterium]|nr:hypothetical protein [Pseudomonadaceae bacterium]